MFIEQSSEYFDIDAETLHRNLQDCVLMPQRQPVLRGPEEKCKKLK